MLIKAQESALNFLIRWFLLEQSCHNEPPGSLGGNFEIKRGRKSGLKSGSNYDQWAAGGHMRGGRRVTIIGLEEKRDDLRSRGRVRKAGSVVCGRKRVSRSSMLMRDVALLPERNWRVVLKFVFFRWLNWTNLIELLLIILLICCCAYQCYELLEDYYQYPTHITVTSVFNDDFRLDIPALTVCDNNRISVSSLRKNFPDYNESHFMAMTLGTFYSLDNYSLAALRDPNEVSGSRLSQWLGDELDMGAPLRSGSLEREPKIRSGNSSAGELKQQEESIAKDAEINWLLVSRYLTDRKPVNTFKIVPQDDSLIDTLICANVWGEQLPCKYLKKIKSIQQNSICYTMFHDTILWDSSEPTVRHLEAAIARRPSTIRFGDQASDDSAFMELDLEAERQEALDEEEFQRRNEDLMRIDMANMEMIRLRFNFQRQDYANGRSVVGGRLAVHPNSLLGEITHKSYDLKPGYWYTYYIERSDYRRLPPPYSTHCYDYHAARYAWSERSKYLAKRQKEIYALSVEQARNRRLLPKYGDFLRMRSMGKVSGAPRDSLRRDCAEMAPKRSQNGAEKAPFLLSASSSISAAEAEGQLWPPAQFLRHNILSLLRYFPYFRCNIPPIRKTQLTSSPSASGRPPSAACGLVSGRCARVLAPPRHNSRVLSKEPQRRPSRVVESHLARLQRSALVRAVFECASSVHYRPKVGC